jgi:hypothetical protein
MQMHRTDEQCPGCGQPGLIAARIEAGRARECTHCTWWDVTPDEDDEAKEAKI